MAGPLSVEMNSLHSSLRSGLERVSAEELHDEIVRGARRGRARFARWPGVIPILEADLQSAGHRENEPALKRRAFRRESRNKVERFLLRRREAEAIIETPA